MTIYDSLENGHYDANRIYVSPYKEVNDLKGFLKRKFENEHLTGKFEHLFKALEKPPQPFFWDRNSDEPIVVQQDDVSCGVFVLLFLQALDKFDNDFFQKLKDGAAKISGSRARKFLLREMQKQQLSPLNELIK